MSYNVIGSGSKSLRASSYYSSNYGTTAANLSVYVDGAGNLTWSVDMDGNSNYPYVYFYLEINGVVLYNKYYNESGTSKTFPRGLDTKASGGWYVGSANSIPITMKVGSGVNSSKASSVSGTLYRSITTIYGVSFDLNGGTRTGGGATYQEVASGDSVTPPSVSRANYAFAGWTGSYTNVTSDRTITANWTLATASFNLNVLMPDGSEPYTTGDAGNVEISTNGGSSYSRVHNEPASSYTIGTVFKFRNFNAGTGLELYRVDGATRNPDGTYSATLTSSGLTVSFITKWKDYTLSINPNGGHKVSDGDTGVVLVTKQYRTTEIVSERAKIGDTLIGYAMTNSLNGSSTDLGGATFTFDASTKTGNFVQGTVPITLTAQWEANSYNLIIDPNTGVFPNGEKEPIDVFPKLYYNLSNWWDVSQYIPAKTGYEFLYFCDADGNIVYDREGKAVSSSYWQDNRTDMVYRYPNHLTVYAQWKVKEYIITYHPNGSKEEALTNTVSFDETYTVRENEFSRLGYKWVGWNESPDGSGLDWTDYAGLEKLWDRATDIDLYAIWELNSNFYVKNSGKQRFGIGYTKQEGTYKRAIGRFLGELLEENQ